MASLSAKITVAPVAAKPFKGLKKAVKAAPKVANAPKAADMMVWTPFNNKMFETFSFLPPLSKQQIARQVDYIVANGWTPCLEFSGDGDAYITDKSQIRFGNSASACYYDNRYWTMWKLPMFGCQDPSQVLSEIDQCTRAFQNSYIRLVAFDNIAQVQVSSFLVHRPAKSNEVTPVERRSVA